MNIYRSRRTQFMKIWNGIWLKPKQNEKKMFIFVMNNKTAILILRTRRNGIHHLSFPK